VHAGYRVVGWNRSRARRRTSWTLVGELNAVVRTTATVLADQGEHLQAGQFIMTGSVFPPLAVTRGQRVQVHLPPLGTVSVSFS
jgi:2-keto-4-pentenoate hydratase